MVQLMHTCHLLCHFYSRLVLPFWYRLTEVVLETMPLNRCSVVASSCLFVDTESPVLSLSQAVYSSRQPDVCVTLCVMYIYMMVSVSVHDVYLRDGVSVSVQSHRCSHCHKLFAHRGNLMRHLALHDPTNAEYQVVMILSTITITGTSCFFTVTHTHV